MAATYSHPLHPSLQRYSFFQVSLYMSTYIIFKISYSIIPYILLQNFPFPLIYAHIHLALFCGCLVFAGLYNLFSHSIVDATQFPNYCYCGQRCREPHTLISACIRLSASMGQILSTGPTSQVCSFL